MADALPVHHCPVCHQQTKVYFQASWLPNSGWNETFNGDSGYFAATCETSGCPMHGVTLPLSRWSLLTDSDIDAYRTMQRIRAAQK